MRRWLVLPLLLLATACGDDSTSPGTTPDPAEVSGIYEICSLSFDPEGSLLPAVDVAAAVFERDNPQVPPPRLRLDPDAFQLTYTPSGRFVESQFRGTPRFASENTVRLRFTEAARAANELLLPAELVLTYQATPRALTTTPQQRTHEVPGPEYARLAGVQNDPNVPNRVAGRLSARFAPSCP